ncbi:MAG: mechanosensitive ion channel family protein [Candidatus Auribacter fodinae]|jgi:small-conductance mechanosensitive channel|uniref:Mechanosensitive ion channel family protein n=1 Tax=Candidatus Auribacter fodinae TaxID=2093366 RepID=A0A3A4R8X7_9BACT|nr:MAG: mechanosensitive ion channel family protein [Candidatus Auribacter fodinae]
MNEILDAVILNNAVRDYCIALVMLIVGVVCLKIVRRLSMNYLQKIVDKTKSGFNNFLLTVFNKTVVPMLYIGLIILALSGLELHQGMRWVIKVSSLALFTLYMGLFVVAVIRYYLMKQAFKHIDPQQRESFIKGILPAVRIIVWGICIVFLLDNLGFQIKTIIASLGIGGVAIALASQAILEDLFCYFAILFDQPFHVGDFIIIDDYLGSIEHIGIKTTRIRSLSGEQLVFSNKDLTNARLRNYKRMEERRVLFKLGVVYQTDLDVMKKIPEIIKNIIVNTPDTRFDRAHFSAFGDFNLIIEVVYYVLASDYNKYMDIQQSINFAIKEKFKEQGIEFAYPTQTLYVENNDTCTAVNEPKTV